MCDIYLGQQTAGTILVAVRPTGMGVEYPCSIKMSTENLGESWRLAYDVRAATESWNRSNLPARIDLTTFFAAARTLEMKRANCTFYWVMCLV